MKRVAIIGGGWAGLACAHGLTEACRQAGEPAEIWLFEASPHAGGRARGIRWETSLGETPIDNGQHLLIGAYSQTWKLLRTVGVPLDQAWSDSALHWAAYKGYPSLMQMLIYSGFDPQKPDNFGSSPLHLACISGNLMAVKLLCAKVSSFPRASNPLEAIH